jgi:hypothetical protein
MMTEMTGKVKLDEDDIITVDKNEDEINGKENASIEIISLETNQTDKKRRPYLELQANDPAWFVKPLIDDTSNQLIGIFQTLI